MLQANFLRPELFRSGDSPAFGGFYPLGRRQQTPGGTANRDDDVLLELCDLAFGLAELDARPADVLAGGGIPDGDGDDPEGAEFPRATSLVVVVELSLIHI